MDDNGVPSDADKVRIISGFMGLSPPGEFNEVFNDCRALVNNDDLLKKAAAGKIADYDMDQLTPCVVEGLEHKCLVTPFNQLPDMRYYDPKSGTSFRFDHYKKEAMDPQSMAPLHPETAALRLALDDAWTDYCSEDYKHGVPAVFDQSDNEKKQFVLCIEAHQFQNQNFWNGRWRSVWTLTIPDGGSRAELKGTIRVQVHYYEEGNVQLEATKDEELTVDVENDSSAFAQTVTSAIREVEGEYQKSINDNYKWLNEKTFKALRRQLPLTRSKIDWQKILTYRVASEISNKQ